MSFTVKILAFAGSARKDSYNKKTVKIAVGGALKAGADVKYIDLNDFPLPLFHADLESDKGMPDNAKTLKQMMIEADGLLISAPEYNSSITPLLKNTIDWCSRKTEDDEIPLQAYKGKVGALMSASPGALGGLRGLVVVRMLLENIGVMVLPQQVAISRASEAFDDKDQLKDAQKQKAIEDLGHALVDMCAKLQR